MRTRQLRRKLNVGEYSFDIQIDRQILMETFKAHPKLWEVMSNASEEKADISKIKSIDEVSELLEQNDIIEEEKPLFCKDALAKMAVSAGSDVDVDKFIEYCEDNYCDEEVYDKVFEFALLGFTVGKGEEKKPKLKVQLN